MFSFAVFEIYVNLIFLYNLMEKRQYEGLFIKIWWYQRKINCSFLNKKLHQLNTIESKLQFVSSVSDDRDIKFKIQNKVICMFFRYNQIINTENFKKTEKIDMALQITVYDTLTVFLCINLSSASCWQWFCSVVKVHFLYNGIYHEFRKWTDLSAVSLRQVTDNI